MFCHVSVEKVSFMRTSKWGILLAVKLQCYLSLSLLNLISGRFSFFQFLTVWFRGNTQICFNISTVQETRKFVTKIKNQLKSSRKGDGKTLPTQSPESSCLHIKIPVQIILKKHALSVQEWFLESVTPSMKYLLLPCILNVM